MRETARPFAEAVPILLGTAPAGDALQRWMHLFIDYIATKRLILPSRSAAPGASSMRYATFSELITGAIATLVQRAVAAG